MENRAGWTCVEQDLRAMPPYSGEMGTGDGLRGPTRKENRMTSAGMEGFARIKVIGIGGGGCNAVARMVKEQIEGREPVP